MKINSHIMRNTILKLYREMPEVADSDKLLIAKIWEMEGWDPEQSVYNNLRQVSSPETIRRTRQKMVQEGLIEPSQTVTERRYQEFKKARMSL